MDFKKIESKWQKAWEKNKVFEANPDKRKKYFLNFPYPYINAYSHIGHLYTLMRVEAYARYKRLQGFNVLFPQGWHATGSPIVNAANRVKDREEKQIKIMKDMGFKEKDFKKFEDSAYWIEFFAPEFEKDYKSVGLAIDWRRQFYTTNLNKHYDKFIRWQFNKLKQSGFVKQGKFPVVWCEKDNSAVGDHARVEGEGETSQEFCLFKFKLDDKRCVVTATLRPDTIMGITNIYVNPEEEYIIAKVNNEEWIIGKPIISKLKNQEFQVKEIGKIKGKELLGKHATFPLGNVDVPILPATFLDINYGTGIVHSVPSDSADDLIALKNLQENDKLLDKYGLDKEKIKKIKPIEIFDTPEIGGNSAQYFLDKYKVQNQNQRNLLEKIKKELYKLTFTKSTFNEKYKKGFSKSLKGIRIEKGQNFIKKELKQKNYIDFFYELTGKVVCRCLTPAIVKIVDDQWFLDYSDENWKKKVHSCLNNMKLYPEKARSQFEYVIDWLRQWACTREEGLGTRLPWDEKWVIESLSDSTIYMAYYTIVHHLEKLKIDKVNDEVFDYIFLDKPFSKNIQLSKKDANIMKKEFEYFYPVDFRNSGKDLIQNHLTFFIFNHVAIFPKKYWPQAIGSNGWVMIDGQKMSKSLGNMISLREMMDKFGADASRITILNGGESLDDPNWDTGFANTIYKKIDSLFSSMEKINTRKDYKNIDKWAESKINRIIKESTDYMNETLFRSAIQKIFFEGGVLVKSYLNKSSNNPNKEVFKKIRQSLTVMLSPFTPHICEEYYEQYGYKGFVSQVSWPKFDDKKINLKTEVAEDLIDQTRKDIIQIKELAKVEKPKKITIIVSAKWKYTFFKDFKKLINKTRNPCEILKTLMQGDLKQFGKDISKMVPKLLSDSSKIPLTVLSQKTELDALKQDNSISEEFGCDVQVLIAEKSREQKANNAAPGKPAIIIE